MRREGRMHGYEFNKDFVRTKVSNKPTNRSKFTGRCRRARCQNCHWHPFNKSIKKSKGQRKANCLDLTSNHLMHEWAFHKQHCKKEGERWTALMGSEVEENADVRPRQPYADEFVSIAEKFVSVTDKHEEECSVNNMQDVECMSDGSLNSSYGDVCDTDSSWVDAYESEDHLEADYDDWCIC